MDTFLTKKDIDEFVLILKGESAEQIEQDGIFLAGLIQNEVEKGASLKVSIGIGRPQQRLGDLHSSFAEALAKVRDTTDEPGQIDLQKLDQSALKQFLETGSPEEFDPFFERFIRPLAEAALHSKLLKHYILIDLVLTAAQAVSDLGGEVDQIIPEIHHGDDFLAGIKTLDQVREGTRRLFTAAVVFRDSQANSDRSILLRQAKNYIDGHYSNPALSLNEVARQVNFSPNHFSAVFSDETGETFRDYLTHTRVEQAKKLLRTSKLKCAEVAFQCGYNDPHYFSMIFRKNTGFTPQQFRETSKREK
jgi:two-component system response regulator YesN